MACHCTFAWPHGCPLQGESATEGQRSAIPQGPKDGPHASGLDPPLATSQPAPVLVACSLLLLPDTNSVSQESQGDR